VPRSDWRTISSGCSRARERATLDTPQRHSLPRDQSTRLTQPSGGSIALRHIELVGVYLVSFLPCTKCGQRERGKLAGIYAYWYAEDESRSAWRLRYCVVCLTELLASLKNGVSADSSLLTVCPMCGTDSSTNLSGIFLTIYPPKQPEREYALTTCVSCAEKLQTSFAMGDPLQDRNNAGAAAPANASSAAWANLPW
jgi:hypothetical protein